MDNVTLTLQRCCVGCERNGSSKTVSGAIMQQHFKHPLSSEESRDDACQNVSSGNLRILDKNGGPEQHFDLHRIRSTAELGRRHSG